jgi:integrase/recombinase XerD
MKKAEASIYLDELREKKNGKCSVKIRITFNRTRKYFPTGIDLTKSEFEKVIGNERRNAEQKEIVTKLNFFLTKANNVIKDLTVFTFDTFEQNFLEQRNAHNSVSFAFDKRIDELKIEKRLGTANSYECAKNSLEKFKKNLTFAEITATLLHRYENWMLASGKTKSTVGIYLRSLRAIYNIQNIDKSIYPFGETKNKKYSIPTGSNIKKALTVQELAKIYNYEAKEGSTEQMAKDYFLFLYLCNGMNVKDFCLLKWKNIDKDLLYYERAKTERSNKEAKLITVALKAETMEIIKRWGQPSISKESFIFQHLNNEMNAEKQYATIKQLIKTINFYMNQIAIKLGIDRKVTTYFARHSFATVLKLSGANISMISDLLGHSSLLVTEAYLDGFEKEQIQTQTDALTSGFGKTN